MPLQPQHLQLRPSLLSIRTRLRYCLTTYHSSTVSLLRGTFDLVSVGASLQCVLSRDEIREQFCGSRSVSKNSSCLCPAASAVLQLPPHWNHRILGKCLHYKMLVKTWLGFLHVSRALSLKPSSVCCEEDYCCETVFNPNPQLRLPTRGDFGGNNFSHVEKGAE